MSVPPRSTCACASEVSLRERSTRMVRASRVYSSMALSIFNCPVIDGVVELEVECPQGVWRDQRHGVNVGADAGKPLLAALEGDLEALESCPEPHACTCRAAG